MNMDANVKCGVWLARFEHECIKVFAVDYNKKRDLRISEIQKPDK